MNVCYPLTLIHLPIYLKQHMMLFTHPLSFTDAFSPPEDSKQSTSPGITAFFPQRHYATYQ